MQQVTINENEAGQRLDKYLQKFMPQAPASFFYKMLRKKNITLNGKKAEGKEKVLKGDVVTLYLSHETIEGFRNRRPKTGEYEEAYNTLKGIKAVYEDAHVAIMNKPAGILSQKAAQGDLSLNEWLVGYLLSKGEITKEQLATFKPSVCNRLDRNTQGLVIGAKSLAGSQKISQLLGSRQIGKFYRMFVAGQMEAEGMLEGYLIKDEATNKVRLVNKDGDQASYIKTRYYPIKQFSDRTLVEAELITGKPHQIRIHMAETGHPVIGDYKYGHREWNDKYKAKYHITNQLLWACRLEFPKLEPPFENLSERIINAPLPAQFHRLE